MNNYPILFFDAPNIGKRGSLSSRWSRSVLNTPVFEKQVERLGPVFNNLQAALNNNRLSPQTSTLGLEPECTVVMEIRGNLENFISIARNTDGLEWLVELSEEVACDENFYNTDEDGNKLDTKVKSKLFVTMANQSAINELIRCWNLYKENPDVKLDKGKAPLKQIFKNLYNIRRWNTRDRLENSYLYENWKLKKEQGYTDLSLEIELWYRQNSEKRIQAQSIIENEIRNLGGTVTSTSIIPEIRYHAILASVPVSVYDRLQANEDIAILKCEEVMYFNPSAQALNHIDINETECENANDEQNEFPDDIYHVAVLDGVPISNHANLRGSVNINDVDSLSETTSIENMAHGTAVCSLIINGDLSKQESKIKHKIYVRPILNNDGIPKETLPVDITYRAIKEIIDNEELRDSIKIINLSVGDLYRQFNKNISAWARLIDYFSYKYNLLFCISTGNYEEPISLNCTLEEWKNLSFEDKNKKVIESIKETEIHRKLLSPSEAINAITVGSIHNDSSVFLGDNNRLELVQSNTLPCTITRLGLGFRNSIKPDLCVDGGRQLYEKPLLDSQPLNNLKIKSISTKTPGLCVAYGQNKKAYMTGTSLACALATRAAEQFYEHIEQIAQNIPDNIAVLLKALLVHSCAWDDFENFIGSSLGITTWQQKKRIAAKMLGYGKANFLKLLNYTPQRVTAVTTNSIKKDEYHEYRFPLPISLTGNRNWFRLTMTLAWFSPINYENPKYRRAKLWIENEQDGIVSNMISDAKKDIDTDASLKGTVQHLVFENEKALAYVDGTDILIKVNCLSEDNRNLDYINYGLAVTLEVKEDNPININQEVAERIILKEKVQTRI